MSANQSVVELEGLDKLLFDFIMALKNLMVKMNSWLIQYIPDIKIGILSLRTIVTAIVNIISLFLAFLLLLWAVKAMRRFFWVVLLLVMFFFGMVIAYWLPVNALFGLNQTMGGVGL